MIWHIFKKDLRLVWHMVTAVALIGWLYTITNYHNDHTVSNPWRMDTLLMIVQILASTLLVVSVVQLDALPGVRQDWLIRPINRRDLLLAKLLFVLLMVQGPIFAADVAVALADGFPAGQALLTSLLRSINYFTFFLAPTLAFASITGSFTETIVAVVASAAAFFGLMQMINIQFPWHWRVVGTNDVFWVVELCVLAILAAGVAAVLMVQYFMRRTTAARWMTASISLLLVVANFMPWQPVFAIQQRLSRDPGVASAVRLEFQPSLGRYREPSGTRTFYQRHGREEGIVLHIPIAITGLPTDSVLRTDLMTARVTGPDGKTADLGFGNARSVWSEDSAIAGDRPDYPLYVGAAAFGRFRDQTLRLDIESSLTLLRLNDTRAIEALDGQQTIAELGRCQSNVNRSGTAVHVDCLQAGTTPPCTTFTLEHAANGTRNPPVVRCEGDYDPFFMQILPDALKRVNVQVFFRDPAERFHLPVDGSQLRESRVVMRLYRPEAHFTRHVVIPNFRLSDWLPL